MTPLRHLALLPLVLTLALAQAVLISAPVAGQDDAAQRLREATEAVIAERDVKWANYGSSGKN